MAKDSLACTARPAADGQIRCVKCRLVWDMDDEPPCPLMTPIVKSQPVKPAAGFVSALAPDYFHQRQT